MLSTIGQFAATCLATFSQPPNNKKSAAASIFYPYYAVKKAFSLKISNLKIKFYF